ncbi:MAG: serine/threonine-protein kinase, partial [Vicinamibacterales bacterium]
MTPERWARIATLVEAAMAMPMASRAAYLEEESRGDAALQREAADLLSSHDEEEALRAASETLTNPSMTASVWTHQRFERHGLLGRGGFGDVYRAYDRLHRQWVALKVLRLVDPMRLGRFKQEFRRTTTIRHRNVVPMHELFSNGEEWFFTMELVEGVSVLEYVRGKGLSGPLTSDAWPRLRHAFEQLVDGICALHDTGIVHGDIKPANVLVTAEGRVVLLDFGLVRDIAHQPSIVAGTPAYMAPEQLSQGPVSEAADWYSLGMLLYEALTGGTPFAGTLWEVVWKKQREDVRLPVLPWVPEGLASLCHALLERQPERRPAAAQIRERLRGEAVVHSSPSVAGARPVFIGRNAYLDVLKDAFGRVGEGHAVAVHLYGLSGMGKSALVRRFLDGVRQERPATVILTGRCYESESVPFKALDELIDGLSRYLCGLAEAEVEALLPRDVSLLARVFPALRRVPRIGAEPRQPAEAPAAQELRDRALAALIELLDRLGARRHLVLWIDDLQWGDSDSVHVLRGLQRPTGAPCLLLILSYRL